MTSSETSEARSSPKPPSGSARSRWPRFGLRSLFVFAILFCLFFAWIGRNYMRIRDEEAAIETLKQAGAVILLQPRDGTNRHPVLSATPSPADHSGEAENDWYGRLFGWTERPKIWHVSLRSDDVEEEKWKAALAALAVLSEIESVNLSGSACDDSSLPPLTKIEGLRTVGLTEAAVTPDGLAALAPAEELRTLYLFGGPPDLGAGLSPLKQLRAVTLSGVPGDYPTVTGEAVEAIVGLPHLEELTLSYLHHRDPAIFQPVSRATRLRSLTVVSVPLSGADVAAFANLPAIESLRLNEVDDAELPQLGPLPTLKKIELDLPVTPEAARRFSQAHPACRVEYSPYRCPRQIFRAGEEVELPAAEGSLAAQREGW